MHDFVSGVLQDPTFVKAYSRKGAAHLDSMKVKKWLDALTDTFKHRNHPRWWF